MMKKRNEVLKQVRYLITQKRLAASQQRFLAASYYAAQLEALQWMLGNELKYNSSLSAYEKRVAEEHEHQKMIENVRERSRA